MARERERKGVREGQREKDREKTFNVALMKQTRKRGFLQPNEEKHTSLQLLSNMGEDPGHLQTCKSQQDSKYSYYWSTLKYREVFMISFVVCLLEAT